MAGSFTTLQFMNVVAAWDYAGPLFADAMRQARTEEWATPIDADGWPTGDDAITVFDNTDLDLPGRYRLSFAGRADVAPKYYNWYSYQDTPGRPARYDAATNTTMFDIVVGPGAFNFTLKFTNTRRLPADATPTGVTDIRLMRPDGYNSDTPCAPGTLFYGPYLDAIRPANGRRYMDFVGINNYQILADQQWADRKLPSRSDQLHGCACWEYVVAMENLCDGDCWINVPIRASDDYVRKLARLFKYGSDGVTPYTGPVSNPAFPPLKPGKKLYVEPVSNEPWGEHFASRECLTNLGLGLARAGDGINFDGAIPTEPGLTYRIAKDRGTLYTPGMDAARYRAQVREHVRVTDLFREVYGDAAMGATVIPCIGSFQDNPPGEAMPVVNFFGDYYASPARVPDPRPIGRYATHLAVGGYRTPGTPTYDGSLTIDQVIASGLAPTQHAALKAFAAGKGLGLAFYESAYAPNEFTINDFQKALSFAPGAAVRLAQAKAEAVALGVAVDCDFDVWTIPWQKTRDIHDLPGSPKYQAWLATVPPTVVPVDPGVPTPRAGRLILELRRRTA